MNKITLRIVLVVACLFGSVHAAPLVSNTELQDAGLVQHWQAELPLSANEETRDAYLIDESIYVVTSNGRLFALKADAGLLRWGQKLTEPAFPIYAPSHSWTQGGDGPVVVTTGTEVFLLDRFLGDIKARFKPGFGVVGPAAGISNTVFLGGNDQRMHAVWVRGGGQNVTPIERWMAMAGGMVRSKPVIIQGRGLLYATDGGTVISCLAADKALLWNWKAGGPIRVDPFVDATAVYVASEDRSVYKLSLGIGSVQWRARFPSPLHDPPVVAGGLLYQYCENHGLSALDASTGRQKWRISDGRYFAAHSKAGDIVLTSNGRLLAVNHDSGEVEAVVGAGQVLKAVSNPTSDAVYLLGVDGRVACVRLDTVPYLRRQQVLAAKRELNLSPNIKPTETFKIEPPPREPDPVGDDPFRSSRDRKPQ